MTPAAQGEHLAKVTFGIKDTAMPYWGEWMPEAERWDAIKYLMGTAMDGGMPVTQSVMTGDIAVNYMTASHQVFLDEGHTIPTDQGKDLYAQYCATCHGDDGKGNGPGTQGNATPGPAAFPSNMSEPYIVWRVWEGVPQSMMYPFHWLLTDPELWSITLYVEQLTGSAGGGG